MRWLHASLVSSDCLSVCRQHKSRQFYCHDSRGHGTKVIGHMVLITGRLKKRVPVFRIAQLLILDRISWWVWNEGVRKRWRDVALRRADLMELVNDCLRIMSDYCKWRKQHNSKICSNRNPVPWSPVCNVATVLRTVFITCLPAIYVQQPSTVAVELPAVH